MFLFFVLIDFQSDYVSCDHILSAFAAHKLSAQLYRQTADATTANGLGMYHAATIRVLQRQMQEMQTMRRCTEVVLQLLTQQLQFVGNWTLLALQ